MTAALSQFWIQKLGWTLLHFLWQGTAIAMVHAAARGALSRRRSVLSRSLSAQGRYVMACSALAAMTVTPFATFFLIAGVEPVPAVPWSIPATAWQRLLPVLVALWLAGVLTFSIRICGAATAAATMSASVLAMQFRVVDRQTGAVVSDSGLGSIRNSRAIQLSRLPRLCRRPGYSRVRIAWRFALRTPAPVSWAALLISM